MGHAFNLVYMVIPADGYSTIVHTLRCPHSKLGHTRILVLGRGSGELPTVSRRVCCPQR